MKTHLLLIAGILMPLSQHARAAKIPSDRFEVTARREIDGKVEDGYSFFIFFCQDGKCTLNEIGLQNGGVFPALSEANTADGTLKVRFSNDVYYVEEKLVGGVAKYTFGKKGRMLMSPGTFTGGFVRDSLIPGETVVGKFIPLRKSMNDITLNFKISAPGVAAAD